MGIEGFFDYIRKQLDISLFVPTKLDSLKTQVLIDANGILYKLAYGSKYQNDFLIRLLRFHAQLLRADIDPIYVFDGKPHPEKEEIRKQRKKDKENKHREAREAKESFRDILETYGIPQDYKITTSTSIDQLKSDFPQLDNITANLIICRKIEKNYKESADIQIGEKEKQMAKECLISAGCRIIISKEGEGEGTCGMITNLSQDVPIMISEDSDSLVFQGRYLFRMGKPTQQPTIISRKALIKAICLKFQIPEFTDDMLIDVAIMAGCDFCASSIYGIGFTKAIQKIAIHKTIEGVLTEGLTDKEKTLVPEGYLDDVNRARKVFYSYTKNSELCDDYKRVLLEKTQIAEFGVLQSTLQKCMIPLDHINNVCKEIEFISNHFVKRRAHSSYVPYPIPFDTFEPKGLNIVPFGTKKSKGTNNNTQPSKDKEKLKVQKTIKKKTSSLKSNNNNMIQYSSLTDFFSKME